VVTTAFSAITVVMNNDCNRIEFVMANDQTTIEEVETSFKLGSLAAGVEH
jgi:hypothetical protein